MKRHFFSSIIMVLFFFTIQAQQMNTDRPDQSDGATVMDKHKVQLESSVYYTTVDINQHVMISSSLLRFGLLKHIELRLLAEQGYHRNIFMEETAQSQYPFALSAKVSIMKAHGDWPAIAIAGYLQLPFTNGSEIHQWSPAVLLILEKKWSPLTLTINAGPKQEAFQPDWEFQATGDLKYELDSKWQVFAEYFAQYSHASPFHNVDGGFLFNVSKSWMLYASMGSSIKHHPSNYFFNMGFAVQLN
jgi:hypothetical protein